LQLLSASPFAYTRKLVFVEYQHAVKLMSIALPYAHQSKLEL